MILISSDVDCNVLTIFQRKVCEQPIVLFEGLPTLPKFIWRIQRGDSCKFVMFTNVAFISAFTLPIIVHTEKYYSFFVANRDKYIMKIGVQMKPGKLDSHHSASENCQLLRIVWPSHWIILRPLKKKDFVFISTLKTIICPHWICSAWIRWYGMITIMELEVHEPLRSYTVLHKKGVSQERYGNPFQANILAFISFPHLVNLR